MGFLLNTPKKYAFGKSLSLCLDTCMGGIQRTRDTSSYSAPFI